MRNKWAMTMKPSFSFVTFSFLRGIFRNIYFALASLFLIALPAGALATDAPLVVGQAIDLSGPNGSIGRDYVAGITTYFDSINTTGGVRGRRIKYIARDDQGDPTASAKAVTELIQKEKVDFLLGGIGANVTDAVIASPAFAQSDLTLFAPLVASVKTYGSRVLFWRPNPEQEVKYIFSHFDKLGIKKIGIAFQNSAFSQDMYQYVVDEIRRRNMTMSGVVKLGVTEAVIEAEVVALAKAEPNIVISIADTLGTGQFLKVFRKYAPKTFVAGTSLTNLQTLAELNNAQSLEWTVFSQVVPNPAGKKSLLQIDHSKMMKKFRDEDLSTLTLEGYAVAKTLVQAIQLGKPSREALTTLTNQGGTLDIGGFIINPSERSRHLSNYIDIALFKKGGGLTF
jgi:branched-chain amino acid transport system substrate-binding protein